MSWCHELIVIDPTNFNLIQLIKDSGIAGTGLHCEEMASLGNTLLEANVACCLASMTSCSWLGQLGTRKRDPGCKLDKELKGTTPLIVCDSILMFILVT